MNSPLEIRQVRLRGLLRRAFLERGESSAAWMIESQVEGFDP
jgi:hypothetical protein